MVKHFIRKKEDFTCEKCGEVVIGNGYTNHCPKCLYSKHVDVIPGDRLATCLGLMKPVAIEGTQKAYMIVHKCITCGYVKRNSVAKEDSFDTVALVAKTRQV